MLSTWEIKQSLDAPRMACMTCGAHSLVIDADDSSCRCCGARVLRPVALVERQRHNVAARRPAMVVRGHAAASGGRRG